MKFGKILKELREEKGYTQRELADLLHISHVSVSQYETGVRTPDIYVITNIAKFFNVSVDFMVGSRTTKFEADSVSVNRPAPGKKIISVDVLGTVPAGIPFEAIEDVVGSEEIQISVAESSCDYFALRVKGDSMAPRIRSGDVVICKKQPSVESGEAAVVMVNGNDATLKRVKKSPEGITLIPDNPSFDVKYYSNEEIESLPIVVLGKVVELRGKI